MGGEKESLFSLCYRNIKLQKNHNRIVDMAYIKKEG